MPQQRHCLSESGQDSSLLFPAPPSSMALQTPKDRKGLNWMGFKAGNRGIVVLCHGTRTKKHADSGPFDGFGFHCSGYVKPPLKRRPSCMERRPALTVWGPHPLPSKKCRERPSGGQPLKEHPCTFRGARPPLIRRAPPLNRDQSATTSMGLRSSLSQSRY